SSRDVYGGTYRLFRSVLHNFGLTFSFVETSNVREIERAMTRRTRLVWIESPTNPLLRITDIRAAAKSPITTELSASLTTPSRRPSSNGPLGSALTLSFIPQQNTWRDTQTWSGEPSASMNHRYISGLSSCKMPRARRLHPSIAFSRSEG